MTCFHPVTYFKIHTGKNEYSYTHNHLKASKLGGTELQHPCGQCVGCRLAKSREWAVRCMHEASLHWDNCWLTLTLNEEYNQTRENPYSVQRGQKSEITRFLKRLRKKYGEGIRTYYCAEYGETCFFCNKTYKLCYQDGCANYYPWRGRPHYHLCIFNHDFHDKQFYKTINGCDHFTSPTLDDLWTDPETKLFMGTATISELTEDSSAYTARYTLKKVNGQMAKTIDPTTQILHYQRITPDGEILDLIPEYTNMSRGSKKLKTGGIGKGWLDKYPKEVLDNDAVLFKETRIKPPRYYDKILSDLVPLLIEENKNLRVDKAQNSTDNTPERLATREYIAKQKTEKTPPKGILMFIFTIYDTISEKAGNIFTTETIGEAERQFTDALKNSQEGSLFRSHPQDFALHLLGEFSPQKMLITDTNTKLIIKGSSVPQLDMANIPTIEDLD